MNISNLLRLHDSSCVLFPKRRANSKLRYLLVDGSPMYQRICMSLTAITLVLLAWMTMFPQVTITPPWKSDFIKKIGERSPSLKDSRGSGRLVFQCDQCLAAALKCYRSPWWQCQRKSGLSLSSIRVLELSEEEQEAHHVVLVRWDLNSW